MPNHVYGIIIIRDNVVGGDAPHRPYRHDNPTRRGPGFDWRDLGQIKSITAKRINALRGTPVGAIHELPQLGGSRIAPTGRIAHRPHRTDRSSPLLR